MSTSLLETHVSQQPPSSRDASTLRADAIEREGDFARHHIDCRAVAESLVGVPGERQQPSKTEMRAAHRWPIG